VRPLVHRQQNRGSQAVDELKIRGYDYLAIKLIKLRSAFAAALKYHCQYGTYGHSSGDLEALAATSTDRWNLWQTVFNEKKLPPNYTLDCACGDIFAFWYTELRFPPDRYEEIAALFFERLHHEVDNSTPKL
jgi:hypothetical protein